MARFRWGFQSFLSRLGFRLFLNRFGCFLFGELRNRRHSSRDASTHVGCKPVLVRWNFIGPLIESGLSIVWWEIQQQIESKFSLFSLFHFWFLEWTSYKPSTDVGLGPVAIRWHLIGPLIELGPFFSIAQLNKTGLRVNPAANRVLVQFIFFISLLISGMNKLQTIN